MAENRPGPVSQPGKKVSTVERLLRQRETSSIGAGADSLGRRRRQARRRRAASTAAVLVGVGGAIVAADALAAAHLQPSVGAQGVQTSARDVIAVCPSAPRVMATSSDGQFDAGAGVLTSTTRAYALAERSSLAGGGTTVTTPGTEPDPALRSPGQAAPSDRPTGQPDRTDPGAAAGSTPSATPSVVASPTETPTTSGKATFTPDLTARARGPLLALSRDTRAPVTLVARPSTQRSVVLGGLSIASADTGDLRGISAGSCTPGISQGWLAGGRSGPGTGGRVIFTNPSETAATVDLSLLTPTGNLAPAAGQDILVPAATTRELLVRALILDEPVLAVGFTATGAPVHAALVDQKVDGTDPAGVDVVTATQPGTRHVLLGPTGVGDQVTLRLGVPGPTAAAVGFRIEDTDGVAEQPDGVTVPARTVIDLPLQSGPAGPSSIVIDSDQPVIAGLEITRRSGNNIDRAWSTGAQSINAPAIVPVPDGVTPELVLASARPVETAGESAGTEPAGTEPAGTEPVRIRRFAADGQEQASVDVSVRADGVVGLDADQLEDTAAVLIVPSSQPVHAALVLSGSGDEQGAASMVSVIDVPSPPAAAAQVAVQQGPPGSWP